MPWQFPSNAMTVITRPDSHLNTQHHALTANSRPWHSAPRPATRPDAYPEREGGLSRRGTPAPPRQGIPPSPLPSQEISSITSALPRWPLALPGVSRALAAITGLLGRQARPRHRCHRDGRRPRGTLGAVVQPARRPPPAGTASSLAPFLWLPVGCQPRVFVPNRGLNGNLTTPCAGRGCLCTGSVSLGAMSCRPRGLMVAVEAPHVVSCHVVWHAVVRTLRAHRPNPTGSKCRVWVCTKNF